MIDVGEILARGLKAAERWEDADPGSPEERSCAETATGALVLLNEYMSSGAPLPLAWMPAQVGAMSGLFGGVSGAGP